MEGLIEEFHELIEKEISKIEDVLEKEYKIKLNMVKKIDYGIIYYASMAGESRTATFNLYYKPKKRTFTLAPKQNTNDKIMQIVKETFECRESFAAKSDVNENKMNNNSIKQNCTEIESRESVEYNELQQYYLILKKYENDDLDFGVFAEKLAEKYPERKEYLLNNRYKFSELEKVYMMK